MEEKLKVGDIVWVDEKNVMGEVLKHEWKGTITQISERLNIANVKDSDGTIFPRLFIYLEKIKGTKS